MLYNHPSSILDVLYDLSRSTQAANPKSHAHLRKKESHNYSNRVLTLPAYRARREFLKSSGFFDLCFLRRVMDETVFVFNFGRTVIYFVVGP